MKWLQINLLFSATASALVARQNTLQSCLTLANVPVQLPSSPAFQQTTSPFNLRFTPSPAIVAVPANVAQVQSTVNCARNAGVKISVKSGGHSYAAYGLSGYLVVDMIQFQTTTLNTSTKIATVGAGVRLGNMATKLNNLGQRGVPHGTCPGVGLGGHATSGGFGLTSRLWGLTVDAVQSMTVVAANGNVLTVSATQNTDLFWALRGAGGSNFGIVTEFKLKTFPAPVRNIQWRYTYNFLNQPVKLAQALKKVQDWGLASAPKELGYGVLLFGGGVFNVRGVYYGSLASFNTIIAPLLAQLNAISAPTETFVQSMTYIQSLTDLAGSSLTTPVNGYNEHDTFYSKSIVTKAATPLSLAALTNLANYLQNTPAPSGTGWMIIWNLYGGPGSVISSIPLASSSYPHRSSGYVGLFYMWSNGAWVPASIPFVAGMVNSLGSEASNLGAYAPYVDPELGASAPSKYWGAGVSQLQSIRNARDPTDVFLNPQGF